MSKSLQKITLSQSRDIPFNRLVLSQANVRRIKAGVSIEELAEDIARRTLLQSLTVRPVLDEGGVETGMFEIPAGGRRYRALELLVKQKRLARSTPVPCIVRTEGLAEEDSLAENVQRAPLHPLDQFRAFLALRGKGMSEEEIAAAFFVDVQVVKQRLRLASVSSQLLDVYAAGERTWIGRAYREHRRRSSNGRHVARSRGNGGTRLNGYRSVKAHRANGPTPQQASTVISSI
jgi:ParB/RepB/Spo0J family partition protein